MITKWKIAISATSNQLSLKGQVTGKFPPSLIPFLGFDGWRNQSSTVSNPSLLVDGRPTPNGEVMAKTGKASKAEGASEARREAAVYNSDERHWTGIWEVFEVSIF